MSDLISGAVLSISAVVFLVLAGPFLLGMVAVILLCVLEPAVSIWARHKSRRSGAFGCDNLSQRQQFTDHLDSKHQQQGGPEGQRQWK